MHDSIEKVVELLQLHYGLQGIVTSLPGEVDKNFLLTASNGSKYTFKIAHPKTQRIQLEFQHQLMRHLMSRQLGLEIPQAIPSKEGAELIEIDDSHFGHCYLRLLTWVEGQPLAHVYPHDFSLLRQVGALCGKLSKALADFDHPGAHRFIKWDVAQLEWIKPYLHAMADGNKKSILDYFYSLHASEVLPLTDRLRKSVIYNDANDYNVLVNHHQYQPFVPGVIDFGDAVYSHTINDLAIAMAYGLMNQSDPLAAAYPIVKGYHEIFPLTDKELKVLFPLVAARLMISVVCSHLNRLDDPDNAYLQISDGPAWALLERLRVIPPSLAYYTVRAACGMPACPQEAVFRAWAQHAKLNPVLAHQDLPNTVWLNLGVGSETLGNQSEILDAHQLNQNIQRAISEAGASIGIGRYNEARPLYTSPAFEHTGNDGPEWRTVHIGLDLFADAGTPVNAPLDGIVVSAVDNTGDRNYGPTVILQHQPTPALSFYTLYGHLNRDSIRQLRKGDRVVAGAPLGALGSLEENGGWPPHLHFQVMLDLLGQEGDFMGVVLPSQREIWTSICPDPWWLIGGVPSKEIQPVEDSSAFAAWIAYRKEHLGKNLSLSYRQPLHMVRGYGQYLLDHNGRKYLDLVNNVAHVGHEHPRVVRAGQRQMAVLNTNTRYLHRNIIQFTEALLATLPSQLEVVYLVNSGSEANELALRIAKTYTQQKDMVVVEVGYHGNTNACVEVSSYKFDRKGGQGPGEHVQVVPMPDVFRGMYRDIRTAGKDYATHVQTAIANVKSKGRNIAGFICESVLSCGGQVVLPPGYLKEAYRHVRAAGGVCIADEVQTGCGRGGSHFWAFETQAVVPDIVTIGKPIGNGHPLGAVVTTRRLADAFANGMEYFNTFGGNPVSSAIGLEVLNVIKDEGLQHHAWHTGEYLLEGLRRLQQDHAIIGDVRGMGLFLGIELISDPNLSPAARNASHLANRMKELGVLMSTDGPYDNVMKIKPPMVIQRPDVDFFLETLKRVLRENAMRCD